VGWNGLFGLILAALLSRKRTTNHRGRLIQPVYAKINIKALKNPPHAPHIFYRIFYNQSTFRINRNSCIIIVRTTTLSFFGPPPTLVHLPVEAGQQADNDLIEFVVINF